MKTKAECCGIVAKKHNIGNSLVTGHRAAFFMEATDLYVIEHLQNILNKLDPDIHKDVCEVITNEINKINNENERNN